MLAATEIVSFLGNAGTARAVPSVALPAERVLARMVADETGVEAMPRRFQPRLATGFDDQAGSGLRAFDEAMPWLAIPAPPALAAALCGIVVVLALLLLAG